MLPADFHFLRPLWFLALIPATLLLIGLWKRKGQGGDLQQMCDPALLPHLLLNGYGVGRRRILPFTLMSCGLLLTVVSLAGPVWKRQPQAVFRIQEARVVILDLSASMMAGDVKPNRLSRAVFKLNDLLDRSREGRTGLVVFGGEAHVVVPLTDDVETIKSMLPALQVGIIPVPGDRLAPALREATRLLEGGGARGGDILILTDGVSDMAASMDLLRGLKEQGVRVSVLGVGTDTGAPVPTEGGFVTDESGRTMMAGVDISALGEIARTGGGRFASMAVDQRDVELLLSDSGRHHLDSARESGEHNMELWQEDGVWLTLPVLLMVSFGLRKGWLVCLVLLMTLQAEPVRASAWEKLWRRDDQRAIEAYEQGHHQEAARMFNDPKWKASSLYQAGDFQGAAEVFQSLPGEEYNLGNALAKAGKLDEAVSAYEKAIEVDPDNEDAKHNLELVKKLLQDQKSQQDQSSDGGQGDESQEENGSSNQQKDGADQQGKDDESSSPDKGDSGPGKQDQSADEPATPGEESDGEDRQQEPVTDQGRNDQNPGSGEQDLSSPPQEQSPESGSRPEQSDESDQKELGQPGVARPDGSISQEPVSEKEMAVEQWLRQVPDDPSGLLQRKFMLEHLKRTQRGWNGNER